LSSGAAVTIPLHDRRLRIAERFQIVQDIASAAVLVPASLDRLHSPDPLARIFAWIALAAVALLAIATLRELRDDRDEFKAVSWTNLFVGMILITESLLQTHEGAKLIRPALVTGLTSLFLAFAQNRLRRRRARKSMLTITDHGIAARMSRFRTFDVAWTDVAGITEQRRALTFTLRDGTSHRIRLRFYDNADEIRAAIIHAAAMRSIPRLDP
jgi:hypothetical protein